MIYIDTQSPNALMSHMGPLVARLDERIHNNNIVTGIILGYKIGYDEETNAAFLWRISRDDKPLGGCAILFDKEGQTERFEQFNTRYHYTEPCFFGEHLIKEKRHLPVGVVYHEMTAIHAAAVYPDVLWLAVGYGQRLSWLIHRIKDRAVLLFPDNTLPDQREQDDWRSIAQSIGGNIKLLDTFKEVNSTEVIIKKLEECRQKQYSVR